MKNFLSAFLTLATLSLLAPSAQAEDEIIKIDAIKIAAEYSADEAAADTKYKGKNILVTGVVEDSGTLNDEKYLTLATSEVIMVVQCMGVEAEKGTTVTVMGRCDGGSGNVLLRECSVGE